MEFVVSVCIALAIECQDFSKLVLFYMCQHFHNHHLGAHCCLAKVSFKAGSIKKKLTHAQTPLYAPFKLLWLMCQHYYVNNECVGHGSKLKQDKKLCRATGLDVNTDFNTFRECFILHRIFVISRNLFKAFFRLHQSARKMKCVYCYICKCCVYLHLCRTRPWLR